jgi:hypothetical protein
MSAHLLVEDWFVARLVTALLCNRCAGTDFKCRVLDITRDGELKIPS